VSRLYDFLTFRVLVAPYVLLAFYYLGALAVPVGGWWFSKWVRRRYWAVSEAYDAGKAAIVKNTPQRYRARFIVLFALAFISMEIMWRVMFEFLIAYFQMREALLAVAPH